MNFEKEKQFYCKIDISKISIVKMLITLKTRYALKQILEWNVNFMKILIKTLRYHSPVLKCKYDCYVQNNIFNEKFKLKQCSDYGNLIICHGIWTIITCVFSFINIKVIVKTQKYQAQHFINTNPFIASS